MTENLLVSLNDIEEKEASWLVPQRMPKGQIIILAGDGGSGKTSCWCSLAAAISTGAQVFFDETPKEFFESEPQKVLFFSSEDSLEYTLKARLRKAGANFNNIFSVDLKNERFSEIKFNSKLLKELIEQVKPALIVFDPLQASPYAYLRNYKMHLATRFLQESDRKVSEIALELGYQNPSKFAEAF